MITRLEPSKNTQYLYAQAFALLDRIMELLVAARASHELDMHPPVWSQPSNLTADVWSGPSNVAPGNVGDVSAMNAGIDHVIKAKSNGFASASSAELIPPAAHSREYEKGRADAIAINKGIWARVDARNAASDALAKCSQDASTPLAPLPPYYQDFQPVTFGQEARADNSALDNYFNKWCPPMQTRECPRMTSEREWLNANLDRRTGMPRD